MIDLHHMNKCKEFTAAVTNKNNWKRTQKLSAKTYLKERNIDMPGLVAVRHFMCETPDNMFDGQLGYAIFEFENGVLELGESIGD